MSDQRVPIQRVGRGQAGQPGAKPKKEQIEVLLARMEDMVGSAKSVPLSDKCLVNRDDLLFMLRMVREGLPEEISQAKWLLEQNKQLIAEARKEAESIMRDAEAQTARMIDEHEVTQQARMEASDMMQQATRQSTEIRENAVHYAKGILDDLDKQLTEMLVYIKKNNKDLQ
ncbi:MAG TPA: ATP synthase F0 subunit B [Clostridiaceae bacterium]|jgi:cell division septum initiation protein DivIVA|nr:ATP synthase F0 subunit B [Clostridiaceae bacterium]